MLARRLGFAILDLINTLAYSHGHAYININISHSHSFVRSLKTSFRCIIVGDVAAA